MPSEANLSRFLVFCEAVQAAHTTNSEGKLFLRAVAIGYHYPSVEPPQGGGIETAGYELGRRIRAKGLSK